MTTAPPAVVVAGAGPSGLLLAGDLAASGVPVTVLEKRPKGISNLSRAFGVHARTLEHLDARGLADDLAATGQIIRELRIFGSVPFDISELPSRFPYMLISPQYEIERLLLRRAENNGVVFRYGTEVLGLAQDRGAVHVSVRDAAGTGTVRASYLVGADGVHSSVRAALGVPFLGREVIRSVVLADVRLTEQPQLTVRVHGVGDAFGFIAPFGDGFWRIGGWERSRRHICSDGPVELAELRSITKRAFGTDYGMHDPRWISRFRSDERQATRYQVGRVLLVGDAAHTHSPAGGQGMNTGIEDAANLSWKLAAVLRGWASERLLDTYHAERYPVGRRVLRGSGLNLRLAMARTPVEIAARAIRTFLVRRVRPISRKAIAELTGTGFTYRSPRGAHRLTGTRIGDVPLAHGRLYELLRQRKFVLIGPQAARVGELGRADRLVTTRWTGHGRGTVLVRPDGYVAWAADDPAEQEIEAAVTASAGSRCPAC